MIVFAIISYALPNLTGRKFHNTTNGQLAFWLANSGMIGMTAAFGVAGIVQVYLERRMKMEFMEVQNEVKIHFIMLIVFASLFSIGIIMYIVEFFRFGKPTDEALVTNNESND